MSYIFLEMNVLPFVIFSKRDYDCQSDLS